MTYRSADFYELKIYKRVSKIELYRFHYFQSFIFSPFQSVVLRAGHRAVFVTRLFYCWKSKSGGISCYIDKYHKILSCTANKFCKKVSCALSIILKIFGSLSIIQRRVIEKVSVTCMVVSISGHRFTQ